MRKRGYSEIDSIVAAMKEAGLSDTFIAQAVELGYEFEWAYDLMLFWRDGQNPVEKEAILIDIQKMISDGKAHKTAQNSSDVGVPKKRGDMSVLQLLDEYAHWAPYSTVEAVAIRAEIRAEIESRLR